MLMPLKCPKCQHRCSHDLPVPTTRQALWDRVTPQTEAVADAACKVCKSQDYLAGVAWMDAGFGALIHHLNTTGVLEDTIIVVMNDHGMQNKNQLLETGAKQVQCVRYPKRFAKKSKVGVPVLNIDNVASVLELAGLPGVAASGLGSNAHSWVAMAEAATASSDPAVSNTSTCSDAPHKFLELAMDRAVFSAGCAGRYKYYRRGALDSKYLTEPKKGAASLYPSWASCEQLYDLAAVGRCTLTPPDP
jgi:arylsulfatase A-like enzyme